MHKAKETDILKERSVYFQRGKLCGNHGMGTEYEKKDRSGTTIKDVARETNLAISTISKYMNEAQSEKNQELIEAAVKN